MQCLILAGGLGTRMQQYDPSVPKTLLPVAGRPFADWQLEWLASQGVESVVYSVGYLGHQIKQFVGSGSRWGLEAEFVEETDGLLGTGGAVRLAVAHGVLADHFFVLYGDSYLRLDLPTLEADYIDRGLPAIMAVFANRDRWDSSNVDFDGDMVVKYRKGSGADRQTFHYIDYGITAIDRAVVTERIPVGRPFDLSTLMTDLSDAGLLGGLEVFNRFYEIGSPAGLDRLNRFLMNSSTTPEESK